MPEPFRALPDGFTHGREDGGIGILRGELPQLFKNIHHGEGVMTDEMQFVPHLFQFRGLRVVQQQPAEGFILAMEKREGDDFIHRHDSAVTKRGGKDPAEILKSATQVFFRSGAGVYQDRGGKRNRLIVGTPQAFSLAQNRASRLEPGPGIRFGSQHLELHAAFLTLGGIKHAGGDKRSSGHQFRRQSDFDHGRCFHSQVPPLIEFVRRSAGTQGIPACGGNGWQIPQQQGWPAWQVKLGLLPDHNITFRPIAGVTGCKINSDFIAGRRWLQLDAEFLPGDQRVYGFHPSLRSSCFSNVTHAAEFPQRLLPVPNFRRQRRDLFRGGLPPSCADFIKDQGRFAACQDIHQQAEILSVQAVRGSCFVRAF